VVAAVTSRIGPDRKGLPHPSHLVQDLVSLYVDAIFRSDLPMDRERIWGWHHTLFPNGFSNGHRLRVAAWRTDEHGPMQVVSGSGESVTVHFTAPPADRLELEMTQFFDFLLKEAEPLCKSALAHLKFVTIHPFEDGNGRIARALAMLPIASSMGNSWLYSPSEILLTKRSEYYDVLEATQHGDLDVTPWIRWSLGIYEQAIDQTAERLDRAVMLSVVRSPLSAQLVSERQRECISALVGKDSPVTSSTWASQASCSQDTAHRDILDLVRKGLLRKRGSGRSTQYELVGDTPQSERIEPSVASNHDHST